MRRTSLVCEMRIPSSAHGAGMRTGGELREMLLAAGPTMIALDPVILPLSPLAMAVARR